ncbi:hypothetical protein R6Q59_013221 [Mikania micrantha]
MIQLPSSEKTKNGNTRKCILPEPEPAPDPTGLAGAKRTMKSENIKFHKRLKSSSLQTNNKIMCLNNESQSLLNLLREPCPLGLRLRNSQSFLKLIQTSVSQYHIKRGEVLGPVDKLKASNFPALRLKIGDWEYVSKYEADLVVKCYFAKHKLVWEVLDGSLKNKIEMQWADIVGLKAHCPDDGPGCLAIHLCKQPLFFRESDPQPRKHTVWQPASDFTGGTVHRYSRTHYLQCSKGVLNKHYEKLIQCDTRLNFISQQDDWLSGFSFAAKDSVEEPNVMINNGSNQLEMAKELMGMKNTGPFDLAHGYVESSVLVGSKVTGPVNMPCPQQPMPISDILNHTEYCIPEKKPHMSGENTSQGQLNGMQLTTTSDEESLTLRINSLPDLPQDGNKSNDYSNPDVGEYHTLERRDGNDHFTPCSNPMLENEHEDRMSKVDPLTDMLDQLPDIASLPRLQDDNFSG